MATPSYTLGDFLAQLPGVPKRGAQGVATDVLHRTGAFQWSAGRWPAAREIPTKYGSMVLVYPAGGRTLVAAYHEGRLPLRKGAQPGELSKHLAAWVALSEDELDAMVETLPTSHDLLQELDALRRAQCPHGAGDERWAWLEAHPLRHRGVTFQVDRGEMASNSGKSIVARWTDYYGSDGSVYAAARPAPNRTNDPERNWGLGRE